MIVARRISLLAVLAVGLTGCFSLPSPGPATACSQVGEPAPVFTLARTGPSPGKLCLPTALGAAPGGAPAGAAADRPHVAAVLVFYRGEW